MSSFLKIYSPINELKQIDKNIWIVDGSEIKMNFKIFKMPFTTRMTIVRLSNNKLWIHSPIAYDKELDNKIKALGEIAYIVAPNKYHYSYILDWYNHYPQAQVYLAKGIRVKLNVEVKEQFILLESVAETIWSKEILFTPFKGSIAMEEVVFFHKESATLILTDLIENIEVNDLPFFYKIVFKIGDNQYPKARTSRDLRSSFISKKKAIESYTIIESWNPDKIIFSHGRIILENGSEKLKEAFFWLRK